MAVLAVVIAIVIVFSVVFVGLKDDIFGNLNDFDGDGLTDETDLDDDNDGVLDEVETELGTDPLKSGDAVHGTLIYDPTGSNYNTRSSTRSGDDEAYLLVEKSSGDIEARTVFLSNNYDKDDPLVIEAFFQLENGDTLVTHVKDTVNEDDSIENADLMLTDTFAGCFFNHTFGYGMDGATGVFFISLIKAPAIHTTVSVSGVFIGVEELTELDILDVDIPDEVAAIIDSFDLDETLGVKILLSDSFVYENTEVISGDVLDIITPNDIAQLIEILPFGLDASEMEEVTDFLNYIDMYILILMEEGSVLTNSNIWFIVVPEIDTTDAFNGLVSFSVAEADMTSLFSGSPPLGPSWLTLHVGATNSLAAPTSYEPMSIMDLWDSLDGSTQSVQVNCYAIVVPVEDVIEVIEDVFNTDIQLIEDLTEVRNPAFAFLVDYNITDYFSLDNSMKEYMALAFVPDVDSDMGSFARLTCRGLLYDLGEFLEKDFDFPFIFCDVMEKDFSNTVDTTLSDIYNDPENEVNDRFITHISTSGRLLGLSLKSVAKYTKYIDPTGISLLISLSPLDVGVYDLSDPEGGTNYHMATIYPKIGQAPNCLFSPSNVQGYYLNFNYAWAFLSGDPEGLSRESSGSGAYGDGIFISAINNLLTSLGSNSQILNGILIADTITRTSDTSQFTFLEVNHTLVEDESCVVPAIYGMAQFTGSLSWSVWVTAELQGTDGTSTFLRCKMQKDGVLFDGLDFIPFLNGNVGRFLISNGLKYLPADTYNVSIVITGWTPDSLFTGGRQLGKYTYRMTVTEDYNYSLTDPNGDSMGATLVSDELLIRSLGYRDDEADWYCIYLNQGDLLRVQYHNVQDANVEVYLYDPALDFIKSTDWSWTTVLQIIAGETGTYYIKVEYDAPGIYCLDIRTVREDNNNNFANATDISLPEGHYYPDWSYWLQDGVTLADPNDYYKVYLKRGQYLLAEYENLGDSNVELYLYDSSLTCIDDTAWDLKTYVHGFALVDGWFYLRIVRDTADGFYTLEYYVRNGTPNLDYTTAIEVWDGSQVSGWLTQTPAGEMVHWYKIYVFDGETVEVEDNGPVDMWLYDSEGYMVDTTDLDIFWPDNVWDTADRDGWYLLETRPGGSDEDYVLGFDVS